MSLMGHLGVTGVTPVTIGTPTHKDALAGWRKMSQWLKVTPCSFSEIMLNHDISFSHLTIIALLAVVCLEMNSL